MDEGTSTETDEAFRSCREGYGKESDLAREGIRLVLNNKFEEAQSLFKNHAQSLQMEAAFCFVSLINALMTFEDDKLRDTLRAFQELESKCSQDNSWFESIKSKVFGVDSSTALKQLEEQIISADAQVFIALLNFLQQDISSFMKGIWVLRKAWRIYQTCYNQIFKLQSAGALSTRFTDSTWEEMCISRSQSVQTTLGDPQGRKKSCSFSGSEAGTPCTSVDPAQGYSSNFKNRFYSLFSLTSETLTHVPSIDSDEYSRLMAAVSFGYGTFQLCLSLLPASVLKVIHFLGFSSDRRKGIEALLYSKNSDDMRAPLAVLTLLWFYTIIQPIFELDGNVSTQNIQAAETLLLDAEEEFKGAALFLFFKGRIQRLKKNISKAILAYQAAIDSSPQREVKLLCLHEVGWCYLMELDWSNAYYVFNYLYLQSRWSKIFYLYLTAISAGADGFHDKASKIQADIKRNHRPSTHSPSSSKEQLEEFVWKRSNKMEPKNRFCNNLLIYEMLYLWNTLAPCSTIGKIIEDCSESRDQEPMVGLRLLVLGAALNSRGKSSEAVQSFKEVLTLRQSLPKTADDAHISAFALYELSMILLREESTRAEGKFQLQELQSSYKNYDFESRLSMKIQAALNSLKRF
nr:PREDICTED: tetratricopeptide repeat protein 39C-like [Bemisia tabaci]